MKIAVYTLYECAGLEVICCLHESLLTSVFILLGVLRVFANQRVYTHLESLQHQFEMFYKLVFTTRLEECRLCWRFDHVTLTE